MATALAASSARGGVDRDRAVAAVQGLRENYPWWAERCVKILDKHDHLVAFHVRPAQRAVGLAEQEDLKKKGRSRIYILKGRQGGFSTDQQVRSLHTIWRDFGARCLTLADTRERADEIFRITNRAIEHFPRSLLPVLGKAATREVSFPGLDSRFTTGTAGAATAGRGLTVKRLHGSEFAFWPEPKKTLNAVSPALERPGTVITLETTASGYGSEAHEFWQEAQLGKNGYRALFFPWWECDWSVYQTPLMSDDELGALDEEEQLLVKRHGLTLPHIKWRREKIAEKGRSLFLQEYAEDPESCWLAAGGMFYDVELLKALLILAGALAPRTELGGSLELYGELPVGDSEANRAAIGPKIERVIIGADTAEGGGGDRSTFVARTFPSWRLLAKYEDRLVTPRDFAGILNTWGRKFQNALLVIEKNAHGITVLRHLRDDHKYPIDRIYHRPSLDRAHKAEETSERIGWVTSAESKPLLLDAGRELLNAVREHHATVPSVAAIRDAFGVRRDEKGKVELNGKDVLVAEMLAWIGRSAPLRSALLFG